MICIHQKLLGQFKHTEEEIIIFSNDEHSLKASGPIEVTEDGKDIYFNEEHSLKVLIFN